MEVTEPVAAPVVEPVAEPVVEPVAAPVVETSPADEIDAELKELYKVVSSKIRLSVAGQRLTPESFQTVLIKVVDTIEELSSSKITKLSGTEKRAIAINLTRMVIDDLHASGQVDDETYGWMSLGLTFLAPIVFDAAKAAWRKLQDVVDDIQEHGTSGCCQRNFFKRK